MDNIHQSDICVPTQLQAITAILVALSIADMGNAAYRSGNGFDIHSVDFYTPLIKIGTFVSCFCLLNLNVKSYFVLNLPYSCFPF